MVRGLELTEREIEEMQREVARHGATLLVVTMSSGIQVLTDAWSRQRYARELGVDDPFYADRRIRDLGLRKPLRGTALVETNETPDGASSDSRLPHAEVPERG